MNQGVIFIFIIFILILTGGLLWYFVGQPWWNKSSCNKKKADTAKHVLTWKFDDKTSNCNVGTCEDKYEIADDGTCELISTGKDCATKKATKHIKTWKADASGTCIASTCVKSTDEPKGTTCTPKSKTGGYKPIGTSECHPSEPSDGNCMLADSNDYSSYNTQQKSIQDCVDSCNNSTDKCIAVSYNKASGICRHYVNTTLSETQCTPSQSKSFDQCYKKN